MRVVEWLVTWMLLLAWFSTAQEFHDPNQPKSAEQGGGNSMAQVKTGSHLDLADLSLGLFTIDDDAHRSDGKVWMVKKMQQAIGILVALFNLFGSFVPSKLCHMDDV